MIRRFAALVLGTASSWANDTFVHESAGNLMFVSNHQVVIQRERLVIGPPHTGSAFGREIPFHIEYDLENVSGSLVKARVGFPLPACTLNDYCREVRRFHHGLCGHVRQGAGDQPGSRRQSRSGKMGLRLPSQRCGAAMQGLGRKLAGVVDLARLDFGPTKNDEDDYRVSASWNIHPEEVFSFDAFCLTDPSTRPAWTKYRNDLRRAEEWTKSNQGDYPYPREFFTEYVLRTGALWAGPIRDFELVIRKSSPQQLVSTCFKGLSKTSPTEFRVQRSHFKPLEDLRVLYLEQPK